MSISRVCLDDRLYAIDNEDMRVGALDADLARTLLRWPMAHHEWDLFVTGYHRHRSFETFEAHERFWSIWALVGAVEFRAKRGLPCKEMVSQLVER